MSADKKEYLRLWHLKHKHRRNLAAKKWNQENKQKVYEMDRERRISNPEAARDRQRKYRSKPGYREYNRKRGAEYKAKNKDRLALWRKGWNAGRKNKIREANRVNRARNPETFRLHQSKRRALKRGATVNLKSIKTWTSKVRSNIFSVCYYCGNVLDTRLIHIDHIIPLCKGGPHSVENLCVSCAPCNLSKNGKLIQQWIRLGQQHLPL